MQGFIPINFSAQNERPGAVENDQRQTEHFYTATQIGLQERKRIRQSPFAPLLKIL